MTVRGVLRDGAIAFLAGTVISARVGAPERAVATTARRDDDGRAGAANELAREVVVWCDVSSVVRGAIARGDVVMVRRPLGSSIGAGRVAIQRVAKDETTEGFIECIQACGTHLARAVPATHERNELSDRLVVLD